MIRHLGCFALVYGSFSFAIAEVSGLSTIDLSYDTNLVNSPNDNEPLRSPVARFEHSLSGVAWKKGHRQLAWQGSLDYQTATEFSELDIWRVSALARGYWQPSFGFRAPWYQLDVGTTATLPTFEQHQTLSLHANVARNRRLTDALFVSASLKTTGALANEAAFEGLRVQGQLYQDLALTNKRAVYAQQVFGYGRITTSYHGVLVSRNARGHHLPEENLPEDPNDPSSPDAVSELYFLDDGLSRMLGEDWYTYGVDGYFSQVLIGLNQSLSRQFSVDIAYRFNIELNEDFNYQRHAIFGTLLYQWN